MTPFKIRSLLGATLALGMLAGCAQLSAEDRALLNEVKSLSEAARGDAARASAAAQAAQDAARASESRAAAAADAAMRAAADAKAASERAERMFSRAQRK